MSFRRSRDFFGSPGCRSCSRFDADLGGPVSLDQYTSAGRVLPICLNLVRNGLFAFPSNPKYHLDSIDDQRGGGGYDDRPYPCGLGPF